MKKLIASILTVLTVGVSAQLTYVTTLDAERISSPMFGDESIDNLIDNDKYLIARRNRLGENMHEYYDILNSDFTLHKTVTIDTTGWGDLGLVVHGIFFSNHLYNTDDKVEIIYALQGNHGYMKTVVMDEDGVVLQTIDSVSIRYWNVFQLHNKTYFKGETDNEDEVAIYESAGTLPCKTCSSTEATSNKKAPEKVYDINVFPNPTTNQITLAMNTDKTGMKVHIYSTDGKLVKSASVVNGNNLIDTADLVSGTYIYNVVTDDELIHASQFVKK